jgi:hypothetical protein
MIYGRDHVLGSIATGKYADLVILDRDIYSIDPMEIIDTRVALTLFDGRIVYRGNGF